MRKTLISDAPTTEDLLDRHNLANRLSEIVETSDTPVTIGVYGPWGCGKTSLLILTKQLLDKNEGTQTVWFNTWQHQNAENIIVPLLQTIRSLSDIWGIEGRTQKFFKVIGTTIGDLVLGSVTSGKVSAQSIVALTEKYEKDYFEAKSLSLRIQEFFAEAVKQIVGPSGRITIFLDDLDRCLPEKTLEILEALKIYLSVPGVVFVLGADASVISHAVSLRYRDSKSSEHTKDYLDKLVQMSLDIPEPSDIAILKYVKNISEVLGIKGATIDSSIEKYLSLIISGLNKNPRKLKKLFNSVSFVQDMFPGTDQSWTAEDDSWLLKLLSIRIRWPFLHNPVTLVDLQKAVEFGDNAKINKLTENIESSSSLKILVSLMKLRPIISDLPKAKQFWTLLDMIHG
jgi:predicted KAP-like P-loop ATPase